MINDVTVVIRSVKEDTYKICKKRLVNIFGEEAVKTVEGVTPFSEALRRSLEIGVEQNRKWTLVCDADVIISKSQIRRLIRHSNKIIDSQDKIYCINGLLYDKALMMPRIVGAHLYRTQYLGQALKYVDLSFTELRPETFVKRKMVIDGYHCYTCNVVFGIHDFFQSPKDLFRKGFLHRCKHQGYDETFEKWKKNEKKDKDYYWLSRGAETAGNFDGDVTVDSDWIVSLDSSINDVNGDSIKITLTKVIKYIIKHCHSYEKVIWNDHYNREKLMEEMK